MTHASLTYAQLLTQGEIFQGDLFMPTKYQRDGPKNDQDCVQHSGPKCVGFVVENQPPTRQVDFGEAQVIFYMTINDVNALTDEITGIFYQPQSNGRYSAPIANSGKN